MNTNNCSAPTMDGYSSAVYWACAVSCAVHIVSIACLIFQNFSLFQHYKKHALGQMVLHILFSLIVSVFVHPMHFESLGRFQPAGILSMLGVSGMDQFNVLVFLVLVTSLALVEESNLWFRLIVSDSFSDRFFSKLMKIGRWVNRLTCLFFLLISCFMQALQRSTYFIEETCPFSFSLNFGSVSVWITLAICLVAAGSFCGTFISSIWLAKSELVDSFRFRQSRPNYNILLHSLIIRTIITLFSFFAAPQFFTHFSSSEYVPVIPKLLLANHGTLLTIISIISMELRNIISELYINRSLLFIEAGILAIEMIALQIVLNWPTSNSQESHHIMRDLLINRSGLFNQAVTPANGIIVLWTVVSQLAQHWEFGDLDRKTISDGLRIYNSIFADQTTDFADQTTTW